MRLIQYSDPVIFLERARRFLEEYEVENNLMIGIASWLATHPKQIEKLPYLATVEEDGNLQAAAMMTPPYRLVLSRANKTALAAIVDHLSSEGIVPPGVNGPKQTSQAFAELWVQETGCRLQLHRSLRIYELTRVVSPPAAEGHLRLTSGNDGNTLVRWIHSFGVDIGETQSQEEASKTLRRLLNDQRLYVWEDKELRSMAAWSGPTTHGVRISLVYTPPQFRRRGYASACVAALSKAMLDSGRRFCCLFTDLSDETSNHIYQQIGYRPVCDFTEYRFER
jgi:predicted GNAT family acetyltransferase